MVLWFCGVMVLWSYVLLRSTVEGCNNGQLNNSTITIHQFQRLHNSHKIVIFWQVNIFQVMTKLGAHIRKKREEQGLLLRQLASRLDMDAPMLSKIERGVRHIRRDKLAKLGRCSGTKSGLGRYRSGEY